MEQVITQLAVKILFDDYSGFYDMEGQLFYQRSRNNNRMTWIRIGLEYLH